MLRFADIAIGDAESGAPVRAKAVISDEPGLFLSPPIAASLGLSPVVAPPDVTSGGFSPRGPVMGPVRVSAGGKDVVTVAGTCINGIMLGSDIAVKLGIAFKPAGEKQGDAAHVLLKEDAVSPEICRHFCEHARKQELVPIGTHYRDTMMAPLGNIDRWANEVLYDVITRHVEPFYRLEIESWETPQFLVYKEGGSYNPHADGSQWVRDGNGEGHWERFLDRDISLLLYFNDGFTGGKLNFPDMNLKITPKPGLLVAFPSSHSYRHGAERTESGERMVLVTWMRAFGTPREWPKPVNRLMKSDFVK